MAEALGCFEQLGWQGTTLAEVARRADVSQKTIEAVFGAKANLLEAAVDLAIRGDLDRRPMPRRPAVAEMEAAPDARTMLELHAAHVRLVNARSAAIADVVEQAARSDEAVSGLWRRMNHNRSYAVRWAASTLVAKPGCRPGLTRRDAETAFWVAIDWGTFRTLTRHADLSPRRFEAWLCEYYARQLLAAGPTRRRDPRRR